MIGGWLSATGYRLSTVSSADLLKDWQVIEEQDGSDNTLQQYVYGRYIDEPLTRDDRSGGQTVADLNDGSGDDRLFYHCNTQYSTFALTDEVGSIVEGYQYDAYGRQTVITDPGSDGEWFTDDDVLEMDGDSEVNNPYMFQGRRFDGETSMYYYRNRYYNARFGRFISRDPMGVWYDMLSYRNGYSSFGLNSISIHDQYGFQGRRIPGRNKAEGGAGGGGNDSRNKPKGRMGNYPAGVKGENKSNPTVSSVNIKSRNLKIGQGAYDILCPDHAYLEVEGKVYSFTSESGVSSKAGVSSKEGRGQSERHQPTIKTANAARVNQGELPDGTDCCDATKQQIINCVHNQAENKINNNYNLLTYSCGNFVQDVLDDCCLKGEVPTTMTPYFPNIPMGSPGMKKQQPKPPEEIQDRIDESYKYGTGPPFGGKSMSEVLRMGR